MKKLIFPLIIALFTISNLFSQQFSVEVCDPPISVGNPVWANGDWIISASEPFGRPSGVYRTSNSSIYVAVPDTNIGTGHCIALLRSSNNGASWVVVTYMNPAAIVSKTKMVNAGSDSIYCFFLYGTSVYIWNIINNSFHQYTEYTNIRDFDVVASSTHSLYFFVDVNNSNTIYRKGSADGGFTWTSGTVTSTGAIPRLAMSGTGDTLALNYYQAPAGDTGSCAIVNFRYRESAPGTIASLGYTTPVAAGTFKDQYLPALYGGKEWLFYTTGTTGSIDLNCIQSNDNGATWGSPFIIGALTGRDEYWFDAKYFTYGSGGIDLIYYSDSVTVTSTNVTDRLYYTYLNLGTPTAYGTPVQISQHWPFWSSRMYIPSLIEHYNAAGDMGAIWVGGPSPYKLYYDGYNLTTRKNNNETLIPKDYSLGQNYPNPFNPTTKIEFSIPKNGNVTLKIYDILGKEIETLIDKNMSAGNYTVDFNGARLSSGTYFYQISSGNFSQTKKMILVK
jgi:hypothetical protein